MTLRRPFLAVLALASAALAGCAKKAPTTQDALDRTLEQMMNGVTLVGRSTSMNHDRVSGPEKYKIERVSRLTGDTWIFHARIQYGSHDIPAPVPVTIKWAGDTPMITVTDLTIPGLGSFTARVLLYDGQYSGTWKGKKGGGQMFGKIVRDR